MDLIKGDMTMAYFIVERIASPRLINLIVCVFITSLSIRWPKNGELIVRFECRRFMHSMT
jgi:hypothetical protein